MHEYFLPLDMEVKTFQKFCQNKGLLFLLVTLIPTSSRLVNVDLFLEAEVWRGRRKRKVLSKSEDIWPPVRENMTPAIFGAQTIRCQHLI